MKKFALLTVAAAAVLNLAACGLEHVDAPPSATPDTAEYFAVAEPGEEAAYYERCKLLLRAGELDGFLYHGKMLCTAGTDSGNRAALYEPDFILLLPDGTYRIIDTKGVRTEGFRLKEKALREKYPKVKIELE